MKKVLVEPDAENQVHITFDNEIFHTEFVPVDLLRSYDADNGVSVICGLENVYRKRSEIFKCNLEYVSELHSTSEISNLLPEYIRVYEKNNTICADSVSCTGDLLDRCTEDEEFFLKLRSIFRAVEILIRETDRIPVLSIKNILFENDEPWLLHFLYIDFYSGNGNSFRHELIKLIKKRIKKKAMHPENVRLTRKLLKLLTDTGSNVWPELAGTVDLVLRILKEKPYYFMYPYRPAVGRKSVYSEQISKAFSDSGHMVFLCGDDNEISEEAADSYASDSDYVHIISSTAENGLYSMFGSSDFEISPGTSDADERLKIICEICADKTLFIIKDCDVDNDEYFSRLLKLPADIIIITHEDYSDYGFPHIYPKR